MSYLPIRFSAALLCSTAYLSTQGVDVRDGVMVHANHQGIQVFAAIAPTWQVLSPPGAVYQGAGNWVVATSESPTSVRAYSARRNASAVRTVSAGAAVYVGDEVVMTLDPQGTTWVLGAYSSYTNAWSEITGSTLTFGGAIVGGATAAARFGNVYQAFSGITGQWASYTSTAPGLAPNTIGNTIVADLHDPGTGLGPQQLLAFSAILGTWSVSPPYTTSVATRQIQGQDIIAVRTPGAAPGSFKQACYSAYRGEWSVSPITHTDPNATPQVRDNIVLVDDPDPTRRFEVYSALSGAWSSLTGSNLYEVFLGLQNDYVVLADSATFDLYGMSALAGGGTFAVAHPGAVAQTINGAHLSLAATTNEFFVFSPLTNAWIGPQTRNGSLASGDWIAVQTGGLGSIALSPRFGDWVAGPAFASGLTYTNGTVLALTELGSPAKITVFDERTDTWVAPVLETNWGGTTANSNIVVVAPRPNTAGAVMAFGSARGDWTSPAGAGVMTDPPVTGVNLAWFTDDQGKLWAYSGMGDDHALADWPLSNHLVSAGTFGGKSPTFAYSVHGAPGEHVLLLAAAGEQNPPLAVPNIGGTLGLDPASLVYFGDFGPLGPSGVFTLSVPLATPIGIPADLWLQPALADLVTGKVRFGRRAEPAWVF